MASRPRIGAIIRDGMERQHMDQSQLAQALEVSRSAVNSWINDRSWPMNRIGALEELLKIKIPRTVEETAPPALTTPRERELWALLIQDMSPADAWAQIEEYRRRAKRSRIA